MSLQDHIRCERSGSARRGGRWIAVAATVGIALGLHGCASTPRDMPTEQFTQTQAAISEAVEQGAREDAAAEIAAAEEHFSKAKIAADKKEFEIALLYAEKAEADAKLAEARSERADAKDNLQELQESIRVLQEDVERQLDERSQEQS